MKNNNHPVICINTVADRCVATCESVFLDATYALVFTESITGAVALHRFARMIESVYGRSVELRIDEGLSPMKNQVVTDILARIGLPQPEIR